MDIEKITAIIEKSEDIEVVFRQKILLANKRDSLYAVWKTESRKYARLFLATKSPSKKKSQNEMLKTRLQLKETIYSIYLIDVSLAKVRNEIKKADRKINKLMRNYKHGN